MRVKRRLRRGRARRAERITKITTTKKEMSKGLNIAIVTGLAFVVCAAPTTVAHGQYGWSNTNTQTLTARNYTPTLRDPGLYHPNYIWPFSESIISSGFGYRAKACNDCSTYHDGVDFTPGYGTPVVAASAGVVIVAEYAGGLGVHVIVRDEGQTDAYYGHMIDGSLKVSVGDVVTQGQQLGNVGSTGTSTGPHLHFGLKIDGSFINPVPFLQRYAHN
ncbi:Peptidase M23 [uncultured Caudovirales phage]|uniref:Peptidase M23 n=1 Tax=uncultured Caudovirales phage TaxID=2100421 RepID=A0A6J5L4C6_9CAUD|nr:Peptidase M23 [uncultured Caudovirales phage]